jgi:hypothetical protein
MIKGLMGTGSVMVSGGDTAVPYVTQNIQNPMQGMIRINGNIMETFDGARWMIIPSSYATVKLTPDAEELINWARQKRDEESSLKALAKKHPPVADAVDAVEQAKTKLKIITELVS